MVVEPIQLDMFPETLQDVKSRSVEYKDDSVRKQLRLLHHEHGTLLKRLDRQEEIMEKIIDFLLEDEKTPVPQTWNRVTALNQ